MIETFFTTFSQIAVLFAFITIGYWLKKTEKISADFGKGLSNMIIYIFLPFLTFQTFEKNFKLSVLEGKDLILIFSLMLLCINFFIALAFSRIFSRNKYEQDISMYSFTFPNSGYFGYPLILAMFGEKTLFEFMVFCIPFMVLTYTYGIYILNPHRCFALKNLINPITFSMILGAIVGILEIDLPQTVDSIISTGGNCMAPSAMILTGVVFATKDLKKMVSNLKIYVLCTFKLIILPLIAIGILRMLTIPQNIKLFIITMLILPTGLNSIVFPESYGGDSGVGAQFCFVSTTMCMLSIPVIYMLFNNLCV